MAANIIADTDKTSRHSMPHRRDESKAMLFRALSWYSGIYVTARQLAEVSGLSQVNYISNKLMLFLRFNLISVKAIRYQGRLRPAYQLTKRGWDRWVWFQTHRPMKARRGLIEIFEQVIRRGSDMENEPVRGLALEGKLVFAVLKDNELRISLQREAGQVEVRVSNGYRTCYVFYLLRFGDMVKLQVTPNPVQGQHGAYFTLWPKTAVTVTGLDYDNWQTRCVAAENKTEIYLRNAGRGKLPMLTLSDPAALSKLSQKLAQSEGDTESGD